MKKLFVFLLTLSLFCACGPKDGEHTFYLLTTNDVHGSWFSKSYVDDTERPALINLASLIDSVRTSVGEKNVLLVDAGDCLQGDNASYYYNFVDTITPHLYPRIAEYMGYDAICVGNHDIETGHPVYDRVYRDLKKAGIPFLATNAVSTSDGEPYFDSYCTFRRAGLKVLLIGYTNANIKAWLNESQWYGIDFKSLLPLVQNDVDRLVAKEKPQVVIVASHSGTGEGDGTILESQSLDLFNSLEGVDFVVASHDHRPLTLVKDNCGFINSGSNANNLGVGAITVNVKNGKVVSKNIECSLIPNSSSIENPEMEEAFAADFEAVRDFTLREVGVLAEDFNMSEAFIGMSPYMNFLHTVCLRQEPAEISIAAPLSQNQVIKAGTLIYNDMFSLYRYENELFIVKMTGAQVKDFLENSYDIWIQTIKTESDRALKIHNSPDPRYGTVLWSFDNASYNFDSAAGINYTVDLTKPFGSRVVISSMADGSPFDFNKEYNVAMTSYRASGGGDTMKKTGFDTEHIDDFVVSKYPAIRDLIYDYIQEVGLIDASATGDPDVIGSWSFVPENIAGPALKRDYKLMFE